jgi:hypothetical protein
MRKKLKLGEDTRKRKTSCSILRRPMTRATTRSSKSEAVFKGTGGVFDDKDYPFADSDQIPDLPETRDSDSTDDEVIALNYLLDTRSN